MLEDFGIVGVSWRQRSSQSLAALALPAEGRAARLAAFREEAALAELAYLETCNRVELVFCRGAGSVDDLRSRVQKLLTGQAPAAGVAERTFKAWQGEGACEHLFMVATGLDSAALGEADVAGQVRESHEQAAAAGLCGPRLGVLFEEALRVGAAVRGTTRLGEGSVSLAEVALGHVRTHLESNPGVVALVGVSAMTERAAKALAAAQTPVLVVNRSPERAKAMAAGVGDWMSLAEFSRNPPPVAVVYAATGAGRPVLGRTALAALAAKATVPPLCIDMAAAGDIDAAACAELGLRRIGLDEIVQAAGRNRGQRQAAAAEARALVDAALPELHTRLAERLHAPLFAALQSHYRQQAVAAGERLAKTLGQPLEQDAFGRWANAQAQRMAYLPIAGLKGLLRTGPEGGMDAFLGGLNPTLAAELRSALDQDPEVPEVANGQ